MEAEPADKQDEFSWIINLCQPTPSQEAKFQNCPFDRESDVFAGESSSPTPTPSEPTGIRIVSLPESGSSIDQSTPLNHSEFQTPPEHHPHQSSSEEQMLDAVADPEPAEVDELGEGRFDESEKVRGLEGGLEDGIAPKKMRIMNQLFGETMSVGEAGPIVNEDGKNEEGVDYVEVIEIDSEESDEEMVIVKAEPDSPKETFVEGEEERGNGTNELHNHRAADEVARTSENYEVGKIGDLAGGLGCAKNVDEVEADECVYVVTKITRKEKAGRNIGGVGGCDEVTEVIEGENTCDGRNEGEGSSGCETLEEIDNFKFADSGKTIEVSETEEGVCGTNGVSGSGGDISESQEVNMSVQAEKPLKERVRIVSSGNHSKNIEVIDRFRCISDDGGGNGNKRQGKKSPGNHSNNDDEIDKFRYVSDGSDAGNKRQRDKSPGILGCGAGRRRELPLSLKAQDKNVGDSTAVKTNNGFVDLLHVLEAVVEDRKGVREDADFLETAKKRGLTFPRPRWWHPEGVAE